MEEGTSEPTLAAAPRLDVEAASSFGGELKGKGELVIQVGDATQATVTFDHSAKDHLVLGLRSAVGLRFSKTGSLSLEGAVRKDVLQGELSGEVRARLTLASTVNVTVQQRFRPSGSTTSLEVRIRL